MYKVMINPIIKLGCLVISSLLVMTSCSKSSSNEDGNNTEAPITLEGKTLTGGMYVDYQEGDGWELEAKDFVFQYWNSHIWCSGI